MVGLRYGSWNGFDYVYGTPESNSMDEVIRAFPYQLNEGQRLAIVEHSDIDCGIYILMEDPNQPFPVDVLQHVIDEIQSASHGIYEFDGVRDFMQYAMSNAKNKDVRLYMDKSNGRYYARYEGNEACSISDFAEPLDTLDILDFDKNMNLIEVKFKEEKKIEEKKCDGSVTNNCAGIN